MMMRKSSLNVWPALLICSLMACSPKVKPGSSGQAGAQGSGGAEAPQPTQTAPVPQLAPGQVDPLITPGSDGKPKAVPANGLPMEPWKK